LEKRLSALLLPAAYQSAGNSAEQRVRTARAAVIRTPPKTGVPRVIVAARVSSDAALIAPVGAAVRGGVAVTAMVDLTLVIAPARVIETSIGGHGAGERR
jgi:hypothetical protein